MRCPRQPCCALPAPALGPTARPRALHFLTPSSPDCSLARWRRCLPRLSHPPLCAAGGKAKRKKWSKGKVREKLANLIQFDQKTLDRMLIEVPKVRAAFRGEALVVSPRKPLTAAHSLPFSLLLLAAEGGHCRRAV